MLIINKQCMATGQNLYLELNKIAFKGDNSANRSLKIF